MVRLDALVTLVERAVGRSAQIAIVDGVGVDPSLVRMDNSAITNAVGWEPVRTVAESLPEIVADVAARLDAAERRPSGAQAVDPVRSGGRG